MLRLSIFTGKVKKHKDDALLLKDVPERYFSEIVLQLTKATASSQEKDEGWKKSK